LSVCGPECHALGDEALQLIGQIPLEGLDLVVDPKSRARTLLDDLSTLGKLEHRRASGA
jgi:hypothetical protein